MSTELTNTSKLREFVEELKEIESRDYKTVYKQMLRRVQSY